MKKTFIIIPCYNEAQRFDHSAFWEYYDSLKHEEFVFVNDGSTDNTAQLFQDIALKAGERAEAKANIHLLDLPKNKGKGEAVRQGIQFALQKHATHLAYFDADFATPLTEIKLLEKALDEDNKRQFVLGSRLLRAGATIERRAKRHYSGRIIATIINSFILKIPVYDTQCGAKLMTKDCAEIVFKDPFISRWLFDVELLARLQQKFSKTELLEMVYEQPLNIWIEKGDSKISFSDVLKLPSQLLRIYMKY